MFGVSLSSMHGEDMSPLISALPATTKPRIDGILDEPCWQTAELSSPMVAIGGAAVKVPTWGKFCWDEKYLYVAIICNEPLMSDLQGRLQRKDLAQFEESIEVFINPSHDHSAYKQFRIGFMGETDTHVQNDIDLTLTSQWHGAVHHAADAWTVEMAIPFEVIGMRPASNCLWGLNFNRQRSIQKTDMWTCWSDTKGGFHSPVRFGHLIFTDYPAWLTDYYGKRMDDADSEFQSLLRRYPTSTKTQATASEKLAERRRAFVRNVGDAKIGSGAQCQPMIKIGEELVAAYEDELVALRLTIIGGNFQ